MALNAPRAWLITYDITNPKRLVRLHRFLIKQATPVQYGSMPFPVEIDSSTNMTVAPVVTGDGRQQRILG